MSAWCPLLEKDCDRECSSWAAFIPSDLLRRKDVLFHHLLILNMALKNSEVRFTSIQGSFFDLCLWIFFCYTYWIFYFRRLILCFITFAFYITFLLRVWDDVFPYFLASTEIISHLYSVPFSIFSHVYFVLSCSDLFISAVLVLFRSKSVSLVLQPFLLIYYLVFEFVLLDSYFYWHTSSLRQPQRSPSWIVFSQTEFPRWSRLRVPQAPCHSWPLVCAAAVA